VEAHFIFLGHSINLSSTPNNELASSWDISRMFQKPKDSFPSSTDGSSLEQGSFAQFYIYIVN
jgi:hypothetical protein